MVMLTIYLIIYSFDVMTLRAKLSMIKALLGLSTHITRKLFGQHPSSEHGKQIE